MLLGFSFENIWIFQGCVDWYCPSDRFSEGQEMFFNISFREKQVEKYT